MSLLTKVFVYQDICGPQSSNASSVPAIIERQNNIPIIIFPIMLIYHGCVEVLVLCAFLLPSITDISQASQSYGEHVWRKCLIRQCCEF